MPISASPNPSYTTTKTWVPIASMTSTGSETGANFTSIPQTYTDLVIIITAQLNSGFTNFIMTYNGDTGANYSTQFFRTGYATTDGARIASANNCQLDSYAQVYAGGMRVSRVDIYQYANTNVYKCSQSISGSPGYGNENIAHQWRNYNAISSIAITVGGGNTLLAGSTIAMYGIKGA